MVQYDNEMIAVLIYNSNIKPENVGVFNGLRIVTKITNMMEQSQMNTTFVHLTKEIGSVLPVTTAMYLLLLLCSEGSGAAKLEPQRSSISYYSTLNCIKTETRL